MSKYWKQHGKGTTGKLKKKKKQNRDAVLSDENKMLKSAISFTVKNNLHLDVKDVKWAFLPYYLNC